MQDKIEANRGRLRVSKEMLRKLDRGEQEAAEGGARAAGAEAIAAALHADDSSDDAHDVPLVRAGGTALVGSTPAPAPAPDPLQPLACHRCPALQAFRCSAFKILNLFSFSHILLIFP